MTPPRRFRWGFVLLGLLLVALLLWLFVFSHKTAARRPPPPTPVSVAPVSFQDVPVYVTALGSAQAWQGVLINPQVSGRLTFVAPEGADVAVGATLAEIDCGTYQAALLQAEGALARDSAVLTGAQTDLTRYQQLLTQNSIARQTAEDEAATVKQDQGTVEVDKGAVAAAQVNVRYCKIASPVAGRVGVRLVDPGNVVTTALTTGIVSVNQITPIAVTFTVPQGDFQRLSDASAAFSHPLAVEAFSQETGASLGTGELAVADNHVDPATGTVQMKARFPNDPKLLWPGQFVNVRLTLQTLPHVLTVPAPAVNEGPNGAFVYIVGQDHKAMNVPVTVVTTTAAVAVVSGGLTPGQQVVTDGQMSLRPGAPVQIGGGPGGPGGGPGGGHHRRGGPGGGQGGGGGGA